MVSREGVAWSALFGMKSLASNRSCRWFPEKLDIKNNQKIPPTLLTTDKAKIDEGLRSRRACPLPSLFLNEVKKGFALGFPRI